MRKILVEKYFDERFKESRFRVYTEDKLWIADVPSSENLFDIIWKHLYKEGFDVCECELFLKVVNV